MFKVAHLSCGYTDVPVVKDVSFQVEKGQRLCILGPNGCGKTTLLRGLAGILPTAGSVKVQGVDIKELSARQKSRRIALMSQLSTTYFTYTVYETVMLGRYAHQKRSVFLGETEKDHRIVQENLERVGMLEYKDRLITELSGGQLQRVFLARVFVQEPQVILLDEPTNHLDLKYQLELIEMLKEWVGEGERCVVGVLHDINLALSFADDILLMEDGAVVACENVKDFDLSLLDSIYHMDVQQFMQDSLQRWKN
ncbi:MAG: ABC transporter ATP-binding protein [Lachnospiraceae bacterium]|nr:ABC transporter ATP-binding protein [Lachnospiraceae bacterium]